MPERTGKLKFALYWAAGCGGCEVALLDTDERLLELAELADIVFWPIAVDAKREHVEAMGEGDIDVAFINGAVRNSEQEEMCRLLREKSGTVVAFGSCACFGGIPGLANFFSRREILDWVYSASPSTANPDGIRPLPQHQVREGRLTLPEFYRQVYKLNDIIQVDYYLPGCPPPPNLVLEAVTAIAEGKLPPPGSTLAPDTTVCEECERVKEEKRVRAFKRPHEIVPDPDRCLLELGMVCCGPATRAGCGARCLSANMPCRGCFGPTSRVLDHGARIAGAIATLVDSQDEEEIRDILEGIPDPSGTFYRFGLPASLLGGNRRKLREGVS